MDEAARRELGHTIRRERRAKKMTQQQLATQAGVSLRTIASIEKGEHATQAGNVEAVMRVLGLDFDAEATRDGWPADVQVFLDMMGAWLSTMAEADRLAVISDLTRHLYRDTRNGDRA